MTEYFLNGIAEPSDAFHQALKDKIIELDERLERLECEHIWRTRSDD